MIVFRFGECPVRSWCWISLHEGVMFVPEVERKLFAIRRVWSSSVFWCFASLDNWFLVSQVWERIRSFWFIVVIVWIGAEKVRLLIFLILSFWIWYHKTWYQDWFSAERSSKSFSRMWCWIWFRFWGTLIRAISFVAVRFGALFLRISILWSW